MRGAEAFDTLPDMADINNIFRYALEVYVDDFISIVIPASQEQLRHMANAIMEGIHDIFPPDDDDANDPISEKKLLKQDGQYDVLKTLLGFEFDGVGKTLWLEAAKREKLLTTLHTWIRMALRIPFKQFEITSAKLRHAFTAIPAGVGLLSPCNRILAKKPPIVWLTSQKQVWVAIIGCRTLLRESTKIRCNAGSSSRDGWISSELSTRQAMVWAGLLWAKHRNGSQRFFAGNGRKMSQPASGRFQNQRAPSPIPT